MHSTNLQAVGNALFNPIDSTCMGLSYGWSEPAQYDADGKITNPGALIPSPEALANAKLWAAAPALLDFYQSERALSVAITEEVVPGNDVMNAKHRFDAALKAVEAALK